MRYELTLIAHSNENTHYETIFAKNYGDAMHEAQDLQSSMDPHEYDHEDCGTDDRYVLLAILKTEPNSDLVISCSTSLDELMTMMLVEIGNIFEDVAYMDAQRIIESLGPWMDRHSFIQSFCQDHDLTFAKREDHYYILDQTFNG